MNDEHIYGGLWTALKLSILEKYLNAFTKVFKNMAWVQTVYIDAFAGTGTWSQKDQEGAVSNAEGSARIALNCDPPFSEYVFIDLDEGHVRALEDLKCKSPARGISIISGDANIELPKYIKQKDWKNARGVIFLDPYDMTVDWDVLPIIASTKALDLWYLFPYAGIFRQASNCKSDIEDYKKQKLNLILGTDEWEQAFYPYSQGDLFGPPVQTRISIEAIEKWLRGRLEDVFPSVSKPLVIRNSMNAPMFLLYFCVSNPSDKATKTATRIANHILKHSQR